MTTFVFGLCRFETLYVAPFLINSFQWEQRIRIFPNLRLYFMRKMINIFVLLTLHLLQMLFRSLLIHPKYKLILEIYICIIRWESENRIVVIFFKSLNLARSFVIFNSTISKKVLQVKVIMQIKSFQKCTHLLYCSVLSLGVSVNTRRMSKPEMGSIFHWNIPVIGNYYVN